MAHEITVRADGFAEIVLADKPAWHGLGQVLTGAMSSETAIEQAGLDWRVGMYPLSAERAAQTFNDGRDTIPGATIDAPGFFATIREDNNQFLGVVSDRYRVVQNRQMFNFLDSLIESGDMRYESCGSLQGGKRVWMLARLPSYDTIAEGDNCLRYVLLTGGHDGKTPIEAILTHVRAVCANTIRIAQRTELKMSLKHKGDMGEKLAVAKRWISQFDDQFTQFRDSARLLVDRKVTGTQAQDYMLKLFPAPLETEGRAATIRENKLAACRRAFRYGRNQLPAIRGTWWQLLNSVTDAIDHSDKKLDTLDKKEKQFASLIDGTGADFKQLAFNLAMEMSA